MPSQDSTIIRLRVVPRSSRDHVERNANGFKVKLTAPPVEGKANNALQQFLAKKLGVSKTSIEIVSGGKGREKRVRIRGLTEEAINQLLG